MRAEITRRQQRLSAVVAAAANGYALVCSVGGEMLTAGKTTWGLIASPTR
jgi:hypothetical protein